MAVTQEIDDLEVAVKELSAGIRAKSELKRNSIGVVFCDADVDVAELGKLLHAEMKMDIAGLTTTATIERNGGYNEMGILFSVLTADDVEFSAESADNLDNDTYAASITKAYKSARGKVSTDPKLILAMSPYIADLTSEHYLEVLDEVSCGVPVFGGVATDHFDLQYQKTFLNGQEMTHGLAFILLSGNVKPIFSMNHQFGIKVDKKGLITEASENLIHRVGNQTFKEYVEAIVPVPDEELVIYHFQSTPFIMELPDYEKDEAPVVRALVTVNHETGAGSFLSKMPEGSTIYLNEFQRKEIDKSCKEGMRSLVERMKETKDYEYSMIFVSTCNARHALMADMKNMESDILTEHLSDFPPELNAMGFYGFGEMCPTGVRADGSAKNRFHNISFAACAI